ncbi:MAG: YkgJ family cysteine cluster protein [Deltaproteobacteria bacterium]|nr:YkgJ family cysteine cluster protein [Deltaproteobacteria bacterium]
MKFPGERFLRFRCTGCGNCCREPLLPLTDGDVRRIMARTGDRATDLVRWVDRDGIELDDEPEAFVELRQGRRAMVLRHERGACRYLGPDSRCTIYEARPLGCRVYPFDPTFGRDGKLRRLRVVQATDCPYGLDGKNSVRDIREGDDAYQAAHHRYNERIAEWNRAQRARKRAGRSAGTARQFLKFLGLDEASAASPAPAPRPAAARQGSGSPAGRARASSR